MIVLFNKVDITDCVDDNEDQIECETNVVSPSAAKSTTKTKNVDFFLFVFLLISGIYYAFSTHTHIVQPTNLIIIIQYETIFNLLIKKQFVSMEIISGPENNGFKFLKEINVKVVISKHKLAHHNRLAPK